MSDVVHHQFCRITGYGVQSRRKQEPWACISGIASEAGRVPGACRHVAEVCAPLILHGIAPVEAGRIAGERAAVARDRCGRRLRSDGVVLLAAVLSYPVPRAIIEAPSAEAERERYEDWRQRRERPLHLMLRDAEKRGTGLEEEFAMRRRQLDTEYKLKRETVHVELAAELEARYAARHAKALQAIELLYARRRSNHEVIATLRAEVEKLSEKLLSYETAPNM